MSQNENQIDTTKLEWYSQGIFVYARVPAKAESNILITKMTYGPLAGRALRHAIEIAQSIADDHNAMLEKEE